ncbi:MAG: carboxymuconolactone decarboxylase family protein [Alphaproteobacteria bacterium]|jgi:AhpD family alkylhydroperoxidase|nr:carboxymuconolactone decarboxylase family protein [Alphaproteobacteria bacterium]MDP6563380.1 carboxymuconolactone decarboxylase family protein [Alphaproteobacteria bacterium]MDP6812138.1 carboxymuconolactone decarboxylase family protein [Alphaproteobacteria bacterium]|tara:strand:- start:127 stop:468 length:342 start_codon:yes stop_codon:yes gene_type:complete
MSKDYVEKAKAIDLNGRTLYQAAPEAMEGYRKLMTAASADGALSGKTKELMALTISVALRCEGCITYHARASARKGASREEVAEAITVAVEMAGGPATVYGGEALVAFEQFQG